MSTSAFFMNIYTGSVDVADGWDDFDACREDGTLVEVRKTTKAEHEYNGPWIEV